MDIKQELTDMLMALPETVHVGSPRSISARVAHTEVPAAAEAFVLWLASHGDERS